VLEAQMNEYKIYVLNGYIRQWHARLIARIGLDGGTAS